MRGWLYALIAMTGLVASTPATADTITVASGDYPPFTGREEPHGGLVNRIVTAAFRESGIDVEYVWRPWKRALLEAGNGKVAAASYFGADEIRDQDFLLGGPLFREDAVLFYRADDPAPAWDNTTQMGKLRVGITLGYTYGDETTQRIEDGVLQVEVAESDTTNLRKLLAGRIDVFPSNRVITWHLLQTQFSAAERQQIAATSEPIMSMETYLLISKRTPDAEKLHSAFQSGLDALKEGGVYDSLATELSSPPATN